MVTSLFIFAEIVKNYFLVDKTCNGLRDVHGYG